MGKLIFILFTCLLSSCTTIYFRSKGSVPISYSGNPDEQQEVVIERKKDFYFWGTEPESHTVYIDEVVKEEGYSSLSKVIVYKRQDPQDTLIKFLTFGIYVPTGYTIMGFTKSSDAPVLEQRVIPQDILSDKAKSVPNFLNTDSNKPLVK